MIATSSAPSRFRFTRTEYHRLAETGIIGPDARVELLDGEVFEMSPIGPQHGAIVDRLASFFTSHIAGRAICRVQGPVALDESSEPEPDLAILEHRGDYYASGHPCPRDVLLVVEVGDTSIDHDLGAKLRLYAGAGIREYWVIDLNRGVLIVHRDPRGDQYGSVREYDRTASVGPSALADLVLDLGDFLSS